MNKVIELSCMIGGVDGFGKPCKTIQQQMKSVLESNDNYSFQGLVYHQTKSINMEYVSLIVKL